MNKLEQKLIVELSLIHISENSDILLSAYSAL